VGHYPAGAEPSSEQFEQALRDVAHALDGTDIDYVVKRARGAGPRRVLSLLLYAESTDLAVPVTAIRDLLDQLYPTSSWN
jgi:hypothetical protein